MEKDSDKVKFGKRLGKQEKDSEKQENDSDNSKEKDSEKQEKDSEKAQKSKNIEALYERLKSFTVLKIHTFFFIKEIPP